MNPKTERYVEWRAVRDGDDFLAVSPDGVVTAVVERAECGWPERHIGQADCRGLNGYRWVIVDGPD